MMDHTEKELRNMVKECLGDDSDRLTPWECDFLDSVHKQSSPLSSRQSEIVERIWQKLFN